MIRLENTVCMYNLALETDGVFGCVPRRWLLVQKVVEQTVCLLIEWGAATFMWLQCNIQIYYRRHGIIVKHRGTKMALY